MMFCFKAKLRACISALLSAFCIVFVSSAQAQIVNVQTAFSQLYEDGAKATMDFSADWRTGNIQLLLLGAQSSLQYGFARQQIMGSFRGELTLTEEIDDGRRTFEHVRYRYWFFERWAAESFLQHEFDPRRRYRVRLLAGLGPRYVPFHGEVLGIAFGFAAMGEHVEISEGLQADSGRKDNFLRLSSYAIGRLSLEDKIVFTLSIYVQPRIGAIEDYRLLSELGVAVPITGHLAMNLSFVATKQSRPPEGVMPLDTRLLSRLSVHF